MWFRLFYKYMIPPPKIDNAGIIEYIPSENAGF